MTLSNKLLRQLRHSLRPRNQGQQEPDQKLSETKPQEDSKEKKGD